MLGLCVGIALVGSTDGIVLGAIVGAEVTNWISDVTVKSSPKVASTIFSAICGFTETSSPSTTIVTWAWISSSTSTSEIVIMPASDSGTLAFKISRTFSSSSKNSTNSLASSKLSAVTIYSTSPVSVFTETWTSSGEIPNELAITSVKISVASSSLISEGRSTVIVPVAVYSTTVATSSSSTL